MSNNKIGNYCKFGRTIEEAKCITVDDIDYSVVAKSTTDIDPMRDLYRKKVINGITYIIEIFD